MGKLVVGTFVTLDGVMQGPGGPDEDRSGGFEHGGWLVPYFDEVMGARIEKQTQRADALLLGRKTYEIFAAYWPHMPDDHPVAAALNSVPKHVASRTLNALEWEGSRVIEGDVCEAVRRLKDQGDIEIQVTGSGDLIQTLLANDLVDEYALWIFPVLLGSGKRLFAGGTTPLGLALVDSTTSGTGVAMQTYRRVGPLECGSFALEDR